MKAMIFAAGLGTRLLPLTRKQPKALIEVQGKALIDWCIKKLAMAGCTEIIINTHHHSGQILKHLDKVDYPCEIVISDESGKLLDTGGGLKKASWFFNDNVPFILYNVDVLSNINLNEMVSYHRSKNAMATVAVSKRETSRYLLFDDNDRLRGWTNISNGKILIADEHLKSEDLSPFAFGGIHVIDPGLFKDFPDDERFSIIKWYLEICQNQKILAFRHDNYFWLDVGKPEQLEVVKTIDTDNFV